MKTFHCQYCGNPVFFENVRCLQCGSALAFLPDRMAMAAVEPVPQKRNLWRRRLRARRTVSPLHYRMCANSTAHQACNFAVPAGDPNPLCVSCRQTRVLPDLSVDGNRERWFRIEAAKRRLFYTLARLGLASPTPPAGERDGPIYEFLADLPGQQVMTGHAQGVITLNVAEADDAERVRRRVAMHEPYRTLLGHLRHESGHFYWDRLVRDTGQVEAFRAVFGDERADYAQALQNHYARGGAPAGWQDRHVSAYATAHPWEDWAETWAHYLHMVDLMETAASYNTRLSMPGNGGEIEEVINPFETGVPDFDALVDQWVPVTLLVNSLNRSLGQEDAYPFALSAGALDKLRHVHEVIRRSRETAAAPEKEEGPPTAAPEPAAAGRTVVSR
jgi:hypothetical protein